MEIISKFIVEYCVTYVRIDSLKQGLKISSRTINSYLDDNLNGLQRSWYENDQLECEANYLNGERHGLLFHWTRAGLLCCTHNYVDSNRIS